MPTGSGAMRRESWARITELFGQALEVSPADRAALLARLRIDEPVAAHELESLLDAHDRPGDFLPDLPAAAPVLPDLSGRIVGPYRLLRLLGAGGMGAVYLAERSDGAFSKHVAIKLLSAAFLQSRARFHREREFLAQLEHPNIARLLDAGTTADDVPYLVMEFVEGVPIDRYCSERDRSLDERLELLVQVCAGVAHAHQRLIVHCDIKPENILVTSAGVVKLLDFGISRMLDPDAQPTLFRPATPAFSSPEQLQGEPVTTASDVYSIGVVAYVVLTGSGPYRQPGRVEEMLRARRLRGDLDTVLLKAMSADPLRRYKTVQQLSDDIDAFRRGFPVCARPDSFLYRARKTAARHRVASVAAAAAVVSLLGAVGVSTWQARVAQRRFNDLREFAHAVVFDVNDALTPIAGTTAARKLVVETALRYLDRLHQEGVPDPALQEELAAAYIRIGRVQGGAFQPNLGDSVGAVASFRKALTSIGPAAATPALERLRIEAYINIGLLAVDPIQGAPQFDAAIKAAERQLASDSRDIAVLRLVADAYHGQATIAHLTNQVPQHVTMSTRQVETRERVVAMARDSWRDEASLARSLAQRALAREQQAQFVEATSDLFRARRILESAVERFPRNQVLIRGLAEVRSRMVSPLLGLGRAEEAAVEVQAAIGLLEPIVKSDANNVQYRADLAYGWLRLGDVRRAQRRLLEALALHRRALAVRRERAARDASFVFAPWELTRSLNTVAELLLAISPANAAEAAALYAESRAAGEKALAAAPSHSQLRKQVVNAREGLARATLAMRHASSTDAHAQTYQ